MRRLKHYFWISANLYGRIAGRAFLVPFHHVIATFAMHGLGYDNCYKPSFSGEKWFVKNILAKNSIRTCIDIGANVGHYTQLLAENLDCKIYAIEPSASSFSELQSTSEKLGPAVTPIQRAVADFEGFAQLYSKSPKAVTASLDRGMSLGSHTEEEKVRVSTLDSLAEEYTISNIDFIKIDTEGFEREVLLGMKNILNVQKPRFLQFEFNVLHLWRNCTLFQLKEILNEYDFYRLLPKGWVKIDARSFENNIFMYSNIVAVRKN